MPDNLPRRRQDGFTLTELMVVLAIIVIIALFGLPALVDSLHRSKIDGANRQVATVMRAARLEAIKLGRPVGVFADFATDRVFRFVDEDGNGVYEDGVDTVLGEVPLPAGVSFQGPPAQPDAIDGFGGNPYVLFDIDGSAGATGAFRIADTRQNFLEVRVSPAATGRVQIRKWDETDWFAQGENGKSWKWN
ncbi:MAG TPA: GspH/FimT family pseudopilin [Thermoanaerobaculia bacterium]|nr:GspH/FimT family pseudopilin [Thermoanaerobaculia bacterium]